MISILMKRQSQREHLQEAAQQARLDDEASNGKMALDLTGELPALDGQTWESTQRLLKQDLSYLKTLSGSKEKAPFKETLIQKYPPLVERLRLSHKGDYGSLDVMWWFYLWHVDLGRLDDVYANFRDAVYEGLETPANWKMDGQTAFLGYVFKYSLSATQSDVPFQRSYLLKGVEDLLSGRLATNAPLKVKMFRLVGDWCLEAGENTRAHHLFELVMMLDPNKGGRKGKLKQLKKELGYDQPH
ncbi:phage terminase small subunit [uncultured Vibrio sp.]|uniref:phage terminase small subunit n=1 Tax=uncultured Vibrio sp. TaxID=114054 RepID=UPI002610DB1E|nr:phage terminase small subunit [uncultured Vibrio sp.]